MKIGSSLLALKTKNGVEIYEGEDDTERFMKELNVEVRGWKDTNNTYGNDGNWWSSTARSAANARHLYFASGDFYPQDSNSKGYGFAVRCVAQ